MQLITIFHDEGLNKAVNEVKSCQIHIGNNKISKIHFKLGSKLTVLLNMNQKIVI